MATLVRLASRHAADDGDSLAALGASALTSAGTRALLEQGAMGVCKSMTDTYILVDRRQKTPKSRARVLIKHHMDEAAGRVT